MCSKYRNNYNSQTLTKNTRTSKLSNELFLFKVVPFFLLRNARSPKSSFTSTFFVLRRKYRAYSTCPRMLLLLRLRLLLLIQFLFQTSVYYLWLSNKLILNCITPKQIANKFVFLILLGSINLILKDNKTWFGYSFDTCKFWIITLLMRS